MANSIRYVSFDCSREAWPVFSHQFVSVIHSRKHSAGLRWHLVDGASDPGPGLVPPVADRAPVTTAIKSSQKEVFMSLLLASDNPVWHNLFSGMSVEDPGDYCGAEAWSRTVRKYAPRSSAGRAAIHQQLMSDELAADESASTFLDRLVALRGRYVAAGGEMSDAALCAIVNSKLPSEYAAVTTTLSVLGKQEDLDGLIDALLNTTADIELARAAAAPDPAQPSAFAAQAAPPAVRPGPRCWQCDGPHIKADSRAQDWALCKAYCQSVGKTFKPPGRPRPPAPTAAAAVTDDPASPPPDGPALVFMASAALPSAPVVPSHAWLVDSGASTDISADAQDSAHHSAPREPPLLFRGLEMRSFSHGTGRLEFITAEGQRVGYSRSVEYVPDLDRATGMARLFSVRQAASLGWSFTFRPSGAYACPPQGGTIPLLSDGGSYYIVPSPTDMAPPPSPPPGPKAFYSYTRHTPDKNLWHLRLGHPGVHTMDKMLRDPAGLSGLTYRSGDVDSFCTSCAVSKSRAAPVSRVLSDRAALPLEKLTWDIWGPVATPTHAGERYVSCLTDSNSGLTIPALLRSKAEAPSVSLPQLFALAHRYGHSVVRIRVDNDSMISCCRPTRAGRWLAGTSRWSPQARTSTTAWDCLSASGPPCTRWPSPCSNTPG